MRALAALLVAPVFLLATVSEVPSRALADGTATDRTFRFTYEARIPAPPAGTRKLRVWVPLPRDENGVQTVSDLKIESPAEARQTESADYGNRFLYVESDDPKAGVTLRWSAGPFRALTREDSRAYVTAAAGAMVAPWKSLNAAC